MEPTMGKTEIWMEKQKKKFSLIGKHWFPILKESFLLSVFWWITALGLVFLATIVSLIKTYQEVGKVDINNFFPPNFGWGVLFVLVGVLIWWIIVETSSRMEEFRVKADKFSWNDVSITVPSDMPENNPLPTCLQVINKKPYDIEKCIVKVNSVKEGYINLPIEENLTYLSWSVGDDDERWNPTTLKSCRDGKDDEDRQFILVANWLHKNKGVFFLATNREGFEKKKANFIELEEGKKYTIGLEWFGEIEGREMDSFLNWYSLKYEKDKIYLSEAK